MGDWVKGVGTTTLARYSPARSIVRCVILLLISGFAAATLVRLAPGFGLDEEMMDVRMSAQGVRALERQHEAERNPLRFYARFLGGLIRGDAGWSTIYGQPVRQLIRERASTTIRSVLVGLAIGWSFALLFGTVSALSRSTSIFLTATAINGALLSVPSALIATVCLLLRLSPGIAIAAVVLPRIFPHVYQQVRVGLAAPHVVMARARGLAASRVFFYHALPPSLLPIFALAGVSVTLAFGASIPIEALADSPGIGQLAWRAALGRDLPVLVSITLMLTAITVVINALVDFALGRFRGHAA
jgi:peptide/nickel transport system permease protein